MCVTRSMFALHTKSCGALTKDLRRAQPSKLSTTWAESKPVLFTTELANLILYTVYFKLKINCSSSTCQILRMWLLPSLNYNSHLCPNYKCMLIYMGLCAHACHTMLVLYCWTILVPLYYLLYYSWRKKVPVQYLLISSKHCTLFFTVRE